MAVGDQGALKLKVAIINQLNVLGAGNHGAELEFGSLGVR